MTETLEQKVEKALDTVRPYLKKDGGDVELLRVDGTEAVLKLLGNCSSCEMSHMTMTAGIKEAIKKIVPEITSVVADNG